MVVAAPRLPDNPATATSLSLPPLLRSKGSVYITPYFLSVTMHGLGLRTRGHRRAREGGGGLVGPWW